MKNILSRQRASLSWGWIVVGASTIMTLGYYGSSGSFGVFLKPIVEELDCTRAVASGAMSTFMGLTGLVGIIAGRLTDRYGARVLIFTAAPLASLGYLLMYHASSPWQLYLYFGVMVGASLGTCFTPVVVAISKWFSEKRVLAVGITTAGGIGIGQMILPPIVAHFITLYGWRPAYILLAVVIWITTVPAVILLGKKPPQSTAISHRVPSDRASAEGDEISKQPEEWSAGEAIRAWPFWMLMAIGFVTATGFYFVLVHIVAYATDVGISTSSAALILTYINAGSIVAQLVVWLLTTRMSSQLTLIILLVLQALALFSLMGVTIFRMFIMLGAVFGFGFGGVATLRLTIALDIFGTGSAGVILGFLSLAWAAGGILGPILAGYIFDLSRSYDMAFLASGLLLTVGVVSGLFLKASDG